MFVMIDKMDGHGHPMEFDFATVKGTGQAPVEVVNMDAWQPRFAAYHTWNGFLCGIQIDCCHIECKNQLASHDTFSAYLQIL